PPRRLQPADPVPRSRRRVRGVRPRLAGRAGRGPRAGRRARQPPGGRGLRRGRPRLGRAPPRALLPRGRSTGDSTSGDAGRPDAPIARGARRAHRAGRRPLPGDGADPGDAGPDGGHDPRPPAPRAAGGPAVRGAAAAALVVRRPRPLRDRGGGGQRARAMVFPSLFEGFGTPPLEAMACGCPVAASDRGALAEICGDAAAPLDPEDPDSIAAAIERVTGDEALRERLRAAGLERAARFTWKAAADSHRA